MPVSNINIVLYLSGGIANTDPNFSLGGEKSSNPISGLINNLFDDVTFTEAEDGSVNYRCIYIANTHATDSCFNMKLFLEQGAGTIVEIGTTSSPIDTTAPEIDFDTIAPNDVAFLDYSLENPLLIGTFPAGSSFPLWVKRTVAAGANPVTDDGFSLRITGFPF